MAEGILKAMLDSEKIAGVEVISSGTGTLDGYPATANSVQVSAKDGVDISNHHSQAISESLVEASDLIFVLAYDHYVFVTSRYPDKADDIFMLKSFPDGEASFRLSIADPIGADVETYSEVYDEIKRELMRAWPNIIQRINERLEN
jgi:protein-tyrosine phosphatase